MQFSLIFMHSAWRWALHVSFVHIGDACNDHSGHGWICDCWFDDEAIWDLCCRVTIVLR
jgi:hypothetical protein